MRKGGASRTLCSSGVEALERQANDSTGAESSASRAEEIVGGQNLLQLSRRRLHGSVVRTQIRVRDFSLLHIRPDRPWSPSSLMYNGHRGCFRWAMRPERVVDHPSPSSFRAENGLSYISVPFLCLRGMLRGSLFAMELELGASAGVRVVFNSYHSMRTLRTIQWQEVMCKILRQCRGNGILRHYYINLLFSLYVF